MPLMMNFAMSNCKLSLEEAFVASTRNSSLSLDLKDRGIIEEGAKADLIIWDFENLAQIPYYHTEAKYFIKDIFKNGSRFNIKDLLC